MPNGQTTALNKEPTTEHLAALKSAFDHAVNGRFLSKVSLKQRLDLYQWLRNVILSKRPGNQQTVCLVD